MSSFAVRGYGRASTERQVLSTEQQEAVLKDQFSVLQRTREEWQAAVWGGFFADRDVSRLSRFREREAGSMVLALSQPGDIIMATKFDRMFAKPIDAYETIDLVRQRKFKLKILDLDVDISTDLGEAVFQIIAAVKGLEVKEIRARVRNMAAHRKNRGLPQGHAPLGWKHATVRYHGKLCRYFVPNYEERVALTEVADFVKRHKLSVRSAWKTLNAIGMANPRTGSRWCSFGQVHHSLLAVRNKFPLHNGTHDAAPTTNSRCQSSILK